MKMLGGPIPLSCVELDVIALMVSQREIEQMWMTQEGAHGDEQIVGQPMTEWWQMEDHVWAGYAEWLLHC